MPGKHTGEERVDLTEFLETLPTESRVPYIELVGSFLAD